MTRADIVGTTLKGTETFVSRAPERTTAATRFENLQRVRIGKGFGRNQDNNTIPVAPVQTAVEHVILPRKLQVQR